MKTTKKVIISLIIAFALLSGEYVMATAAGGPTAEKSLTILVGKRKAIKVKGSNIQSKTFKSTNSKVVSVSKKGVVTAKKAGSCKVKITVKYLKNKTAKKASTKILTTKITVKEQSKSGLDDMAALKKIIKEQKALGTELPDDPEDYNYDWEKGKLIGINWSFCELKGTVSFSDFTGLKYLQCGDNQLTKVDVSGCKKLETFDCGNNQLKKVDVSKCTELTMFGCNGNQLTKIDISKCKALEELSCDRNQLAGIDISKCKGLKKLYCSENQLTGIDVSKNAALEYLGLDGNRLTKIDISMCHNLTGLSLEGNQLTDIDVTNCNYLEGLSCGKNQLTKIDISKCPNLDGLWCSYNQLTELDMSNCSKLLRLVCCGNQLTKLDVSGCKSLEEIWCYENQLTTLDLSECTVLWVCCDKSVELTGVPYGCEVDTDYRE